MRFQLWQYGNLKPDCGEDQPERERERCPLCFGVTMCSCFVNEDEEENTYWLED